MSRVLSIVCLVAGASVMLPAQSAQQPPVFAARRDVARLDILVADRGRPVVGLKETDFTVLDDGVPQKVDYVSFDELPLNVVLNFDVSGSVAGQRLQDLRAAGHAVLDQLRAGDRAALLSFTEAVSLRGELTADWARLRTALDASQTSGQTSIVDASQAGLLNRTHARFAAAAIVAASILRGPAQTARQSVNPSVPEVLAAAGNYVADYEKSFGAIAADEHDVQTANYLAAGDGPRRRTITSAVLMFNTGGGGWMAFRTVLALDQTRVSNEPGRLAALAANPSQDALADAMRATAAGARYNLGTMARSIAIPTGALAHLRKENQPQSMFEFAGMKTVAGLRVALLTFNEKPEAQMVSTGEDSTTTGRFWIEPASGRVVQSELTLTSGGYESKVEVQYASQAGLDVWVPVRMFEQYNVVIPSRNAGNRGSAPITAYADNLATYQNFRKFELKAGLVIR